MSNEELIKALEDIVYRLKEKPTGISSGALIAMQCPSTQALMRREPKKLPRAAWSQRPTWTVQDFDPLPPLNPEKRAKMIAICEGTYKKRKPKAGIKKVLRRKTKKK